MVHSLFQYFSSSSKAFPSSCSLRFSYKVINIMLDKENIGENFDALSVNLITLIVCKGMMDLNWERLKMDV